jgi:hypothetical protein
MELSIEVSPQKAVGFFIEGMVLKIPEILYSLISLRIGKCPDQDIDRETFVLNFSVVCDNEWQRGLLQAVSLTTNLSRETSKSS